MPSDVGRIKETSQVSGLPGQRGVGGVEPSSEARQVVMAEESMVCVTHSCHRDIFGDGSARFSGGLSVRLTRESSAPNRGE
jgi:hypothetical protein